MQLGDLHARLAAQRGVEVGQRLVEQEDLGLAHDRAADGHALALAARHLARQALQVWPEVEDLGRAVDLLLDHRGVGLGEPQREAHVLGHGHVRVQRVALEHHRQVALRRRQPRDVAAVEVDAAGAERLEPGDQPQQRRLAAAGRPDEHGELAARDRQVDALDRLHVAELLLDALELEECHLSFPFT